jgi:hypothetical protein
MKPHGFRKAMYTLAILSTSISFLSFSNQYKQTIFCLPDSHHSGTNDVIVGSTRALLSTPSPRVIFVFPPHAHVPGPLARRIGHQRIRDAEPPQ